MKLSPEKPKNYPGEKSEKDTKFFDDLAERYGLEQDSEFLILTNGSKKSFIHKRRKIPIKNGLVEIEEYIKQLMGENGK